MEINKWIEKWIRFFTRGTHCQSPIAMNTLRLSRLLQNDSAINITNNMMALYGCLFRVYQSIAEEVYKANLTAFEINLSKENLIVAGAVRNDMYINNGELIINNALNILSQRLGATLHSAYFIFDRKNISSELYTIIEGDVGQYHHYKLGNRSGATIWNPAGAFPTTNDRVVYNILVT